MDGRFYGYPFPSSRGSPLCGLGNDIVFTQASGTVARQWLEDKPLAAMPWITSFAIQIKQRRAPDFGQIDAS